MSGTVRIENEALFSSVKAILDEGGRVRLKVRGNSMRPFLRDGKDTVLLAPPPAGGVKKGMVVLFGHEGRTVLHRLRRMSPCGMTAAGDGNYRATERFTATDIIGYVQAVERNGRNIEYRSALWRMLTAVSLCRRTARQAVLDCLGAMRGRKGRRL